VLLHGLGLSWRSWQPVLDALEDRHDVVAIDLPGFGESPPLPDGVAPTPGRLADAVESELDRLGLDAPALVGNSLGGWVALELARRGRAARAVVISPSGLESPLERALVIALNEQMRLRARFGAPLCQWLTAPALARVMLFGGLRSQPWRLSPDAAVRDLHDFGYSPGFQSTLGSTVASRAAMWLGEIEVPVRVAYGTLDLMLGVFTAPRFAAAIPVAELSRCQHSDTSRCSTIQSSWPERSSTSPLTPGRRHDERPPGHRSVSRPPCVCFATARRQVAREPSLALLGGPAGSTSALELLGVPVAERPGVCSRPEACIYDGTAGRSFLSGQPVALVTYGAPRIMLCRGVAEQSTLARTSPPTRW
jgi:pimeloyl-ACP methyl ester carboxylesterase